MKVSVFILTYNQEKYIDQTLRSILSQKTNFKFQLVIGEDASTDNTRLICRKFKTSYPDKIKLIENKKNIGLIANYIKTSKELSGKYIAICDGDDYWIDEHKLQKQVDFLETHLEYSLVYCKCKKLYPDGTFKVSETFKGQKKNKDFSNLVKNNFIPSVTVLFKNKMLYHPLPKWITSLTYGVNWPTYLWILADGSKIHFIDEVMGVYRMHIGESFKLMKKLSNVFKVELQILKNISNDELYKKWKVYVAASIYEKKKSLMLSYNREKFYLKAFKFYFQLLSLRSCLKLSKLYIHSLIKSL